MYPAVDPLASTSSCSTRAWWARSIIASPRRCAEPIAHYRELQDIIALLGIEELSAEDRLVVRAGTSPATLPDPALHGHRDLHRQAGATVPLAETLTGCRAILDGATDDWAESSVYMIGTLDDARIKEESAKAEKAKEPAPA